ncbi:ribonucleoside-diphosphate reductase, adenosylcobalamin-dependent, partial [Pseudomonas aeruginosa]
HREVNQRMAKTDARRPRTERGTIALQDASQDIWDKKYRLKCKDGTPVDASVDGTWQRVGRALADVEEKASREHWYGRFLWA